MIKNRFLWISVAFFCIACFAALYYPNESRSYDRQMDSPMQNKANKGAYPTPQQKIYLPTIIKGPTSGTLYATDDIVGNLRYVSAGTFTQGSTLIETCRSRNEGPQFQHTLTKNLAVMETEVTRQMWVSLRAVQPSLPSDPSYFKSYGLSVPVESLTWHEAVLFANLLSVQQGLQRAYYADASVATSPITSGNYQTNSVYVNWDANGYRLPTEGEWEYFTRAGTTGPFSIDVPAFNSAMCSSCTAGLIAALESMAWFCANSGSVTHPAGGKEKASAIMRYTLAVESAK